MKLKLLPKFIISLGAVGLVLTIVMLFVSGGFAGKAPVDSMYAALGAILWEAAAIVASCIGINMLVAKNFTASGEIRGRRR